MAVKWGIDQLSCDKRVCLNEPISILSPSLASGINLFPGFLAWTHQHPWVLFCLFYWNPSSYRPLGWPRTLWRKLRTCPDREGLRRSSGNLPGLDHRTYLGPVKSRLSHGHSWPFVVTHVKENYAWSMAALCCEAAPRNQQSPVAVNGQLRSHKRPRNSIFYCSQSFPRIFS